ncbi:MAG: bifunctional folylpolyglutamate synthase/dihydrofolate synthase [Porticoccaceae bacterium]
MADRSLADWLDLLESRHPSEIELGLQRVNQVWQRLQVSQGLQRQTAPLAITVAGTNGKGSCLACMQALCLAQGYSVGLFTSPHFMRYNERICLNGEPVGDSLIVSAFEQIEHYCEDISLTYFEFGTLAALLIFYQAQPDVMLLEVGLGGRLDAINIIDADVAVVTSIALDHQDWLGDTRELIAREKLGIARRNRPLIIGEQDHPLGFEQMVAETGAIALYAGKDFSCTEEDPFSVELVGNAGPWQIGSLRQSSLLAINKTVALQALCAAGLTLDAGQSRSALNTVALMGRQQRLNFRGLEVILDVAHNPAAAKALAECLRTEENPLIAVASVLGDKDWPGIVHEMSPVIAHWHIAEISDSSRASKGQYLFELLYNAGQSGDLYESIRQAFLEAINMATESHKIVVFGSFHTVALVLDLILAEVKSE